MSEKSSIFGPSDSPPSVYSRNHMSAHLRRLIQSEELAAGTRLPSTAKLAELWKVTVVTAHRALHELVQEGLLDRIQGKGTYVAEHQRDLTRVAIYRAIDKLAPPERFLPVLADQLVEVLDEKGLESRVITVPFLRDQIIPPAPELLEAIQQKSVQGVIVMGQYNGTHAWGEKLSVPHIYALPSTHADIVSIDRWSMVREAVRRLASQGSRSVGLISAQCLDAASSGRVFYETLRKSLGEVGASIPRGCLVAPATTLTLSGRSHQKFGYEAFKRLWSSPVHPDGLLVLDEDVARGVLLAMAETNGVENLRMVLGRNKLSPYFCPFQKVTYAVINERKLAERITEHLLAMHQRRPLPEYMVPCEWEEPDAQDASNNPPELLAVH